MCLIDKMYSLVLLNDIKFHFEDFFFSKRNCLCIIFSIVSRVTQLTNFIKNQKVLDF
jgi:hypothetical protein